MKIQYFPLKKTVKLLELWCWPKCALHKLCEVLLSKLKQKGAHHPIIALLLWWDDRILGFGHIQWAFQFSTVVENLLKKLSKYFLRTSWELLSCWEFLEVVVQSLLKKSMIWKKQKKSAFWLSAACLSVCFGDLELTFEHLRQLWSLSLWFTVSNFLVKMAMETKKLFQFSEVETHANPTDCWLIIHGKVNCLLQLHFSFFLSFLIFFLKKSHACMLICCYILCLCRSTMWPDFWKNIQVGMMSFSLQQVLDILKNAILIFQATDPSVFMGISVSVIMPWFWSPLFCAGFSLDWKIWIICFNPCVDGSKSKLMHINYSELLSVSANVQDQARMQQVILRM